MKSKFLLFALFIGLSFSYAQTDSLYVMRSGSAIYKVNVETDIDSIIFYNPNVTTTGCNLPEFDLTGVEVTEGTDGTKNTLYYNADGSADLQVIYDSPILGMYAGFDVILPPSYNDGTNKTYPIIIHLHGHGETNSSINFTGVKNTIKGFMQNGSVDEFIFVSVGGPQTSWWSDTWDGSYIDDGMFNRIGAKTETYVINEVLSFCDQHFRTKGTCDARALMGFSMGGWGATKIGMKYPEYFSVIGTYCGALYGPGPYNADPNDSFVTYQSNYEKIWNNDPELYNQDCARALLPLKYQELLDRGMTFVIQNNADQFKGRNIAFKGELESFGIPTVYFPQSGEPTGGHSMGNLSPEYINAILNNLTY